MLTDGVLPAAHRDRLVERVFALDAEADVDELLALTH